MNRFEHFEKSTDRERLAAMIRLLVQMLGPRVTSIEIADRIRASGTPVANRTVNKIRAEMGLPRQGE